MISNIDSSSYELLEPIAVTPYINRNVKSNKRHSNNYNNLEIPIDKIKKEPNKEEIVAPAPVPSLSNINEMVKIYPQINVKPLKLDDLHKYNCDNNKNTILQEELQHPIVHNTHHGLTHPNHNKEHTSTLNNSRVKYKNFNKKLLKTIIKQKKQNMTDKENSNCKDTSNATQRTTRNSMNFPTSKESIIEKGLINDSKSDSDNMVRIRMYNIKRK